MSADSEAVQRAQQRLGSVLRGKYRLDRVLGIGGMAVVYAATHRNQKQFAVKVLHPELSLNPDVRGRFLREGYAANSVKHSGALAVLDDDTAEDGAAFLVMELLEGASIEELWEQSQAKLPLGPVLGVAYQALDVLAAAHAKGILHRDVKPANLFLTYEGVVKVLDFGIARVRDAAASGAQQTGAGILLGTPAFMAPEQALGRVSEMDPRTDLWAMGATLFTLLSGRLVHSGETGPEVLIRAATTAAPSLAAVSPGTPPPVVAVVDRALAFEKGQRWPGAEAMRDAIVQAQIAVFGQRVSAEVLSVLCRGLGRTFALTRARQEAAPPPAGASVPVVPPPALSPVAPARGRVAGTQPDAGGAAPIVDGLDRAVPQTSLLSGTTARPVFTEEPLAPAGLPDRRPFLIAAAFAGAAVVAGGVAFGIHSVTSATSASSSASVTMQPDAAQTLAPLRSTQTLPPGHPELAGSAAAPVSPAVSALVPAVTSTFSPISAAPASAAGPSRAAPVEGDARPPAGRSMAPSPSFALPPSATLPPTGATAAPTAGSPSCRPPFYFDSAGNKVFKKECL
ncbi:MAG TPA: protein kinase [Polyangiaceae bacterium]|nr:protein kinase [Polyangiaceae bacterium]